MSSRDHRIRDEAHGSSLQKRQPHPSDCLLAAPCGKLSKSFSKFQYRRKGARATTRNLGQRVIRRAPRAKVSAPVSALWVVFGHAFAARMRIAPGKTKPTLQKDSKHVGKQIKDTQDQAKARLDQAKAEMDARIRSLQDQAKGASDRAKARIEKRIAEVKADFQVRSQKLNQAWTLTREALAAQLSQNREGCGWIWRTDSKAV